MLPVTTSAFILSFIRGIETFESPLFFGAPVGIEVITTRSTISINHRAKPDYQSATALGFAAMVAHVPAGGRADGGCCAAAASRR